MPAVTPCERHLPPLDGGTDADILRNRTDTWAMYQTCRDSLDLVIEADRAYNKATNKAAPTM